MATATKNDAIEVELYKPDQSAAKYEAHVQALIAADAERTPEQIADGFHATVKITFPKAENGKPVVERHKRWFRESAKAHDLSAHVAEETDNGDTITVRYYVDAKVTRPRKPKTDDSAPATDDVPESVPAAA